MQCMRRVTRSIEMAVALGLIVFLPPALAGTVITANLPANTAIVNISGTQDGAASYNGDQSLWYHPFSTVGTLLEYTVQPFRTLLT